MIAHAQEIQCTPVKVTTAQLNVRSAPSISGNIVGHLAKNNIVCAYGQQGNWIQTDKGWISSQYIKVLQANSKQSTNSTQNVPPTKTKLVGTMMMIYGFILIILMILVIVLIFFWAFVKAILYFVSFGFIDMDKVKNDNTKLVIKDVHYLLKVMANMFFSIIFLYAVVYAGIGLILSTTMPLTLKELESILHILGIVFLIIFTLFYLKIFFIFNRGYVIDLEKEHFCFPATDVENHLTDFFTFRRLREYAKAKCVPLNEITDIYLDTTKERRYNPTTKRYRQEPVYRLNIVGPYGSDNLIFSSRQKRNEVRGILVQAAKTYKLNIRDRKVAEFQ